MEHESDGDTDCNWRTLIGTGTEDLKIRGQMETIQTTALLILATILRRFLET